MEPSQLDEMQEAKTWSAKLHNILRPLSGIKMMLNGSRQMQIDCSRMHNELVDNNNEFRRCMADVQNQMKEIKDKRPVQEHSNELAQLPSKSDLVAKVEMLRQENDKLTKELAEYDTKENLERSIKQVQASVAELKSKVPMHRHVDKPERQSFYALFSSEGSPENDDW